MKFFKTLVFLSLLLVLLHNCARKGRPSGGPKDETAPIMVIAKPANETVNFKENNIRIYFDEYIVLKNLSKQLIVSPPFKNSPLITPQGTASKYINIEILDTLKPNTTYTFNFGDAIQDNNENNKLERFKYVFSTGDFLDSLKIGGSVKDAVIEKPSKNYNVLLYKIDSTYNDSLVFKRKPDYVTKTIDSVNFEFTNIAEGDYKVFALDEENSDYLFSPSTDKIGFYETTVSLPKDTLITTPIIVFTEELPYKFKRGKEETKGKIFFGYSGKQDSMKVELISKVPADFRSFSRLEKESDSLSYWHTPVEADSLNFIVTNKEVIDTATVRLRKKKIDSLQISSTIKGSFHINDTLAITTNNPIISYDESKFSLVDADTTAIDFKLQKVDFDKIHILFDKKIKTSYRLTLLPEAIEDLFLVKSKDTLVFRLSTKETEDYGNISLDVKKNLDSPVIIELLSKNIVVKKEVVTSSKKIEFALLEPKEYTIRAIIDENNNGIWDTGNYLLSKQPEKIVYFPQKIELRANWFFNETFTIEK